MSGKKFLIGLGDSRVSAELSAGDDGKEDSGRIPTGLRGFCVSSGFNIMSGAALGTAGDYILPEAGINFALPGGVGGCISTGFNGNCLPHGAGGRDVFPNVDVSYPSAGAGGYISSETPGNYILPEAGINFALPYGGGDCILPEAGGRYISAEASGRYISNGDDIFRGAGGGCSLTGALTDDINVRANCNYISPAFIATGFSADAGGSPETGRERIYPRTGRTYVAIDLKSFYASVECRERGLDPLSTNLVVADRSRTEKTICLAVSPSLKAYGIPGRPRLFEVVRKVGEINAERVRKAPRRRFTGLSWRDGELRDNPSLAVSYIVAPPRMARYIEYSKKIYNVYLKYIAPEDIHVYSIDEVFIDVTGYLMTYGMSAHDLARQMIRDVLETTGITATAGIGPNLYLCKIAMDIVAKKMPPDGDGVRIAELDEAGYRERLWDHTPLTDFWRIGGGYAKKLERHNMFTMRDIAEQSLRDERLLYKLFGVNAETLIYHAWGRDPATIADIKAYKPASCSLSSGQVLTEPYTFEKARLVTREMTDLLALDMVDKGLVAAQMTLTVGYDVENIARGYAGETSVDHYGRTIPKHAHGTANLGRFTSSSKLMTEAVTELYERIVGRDMLVRRINIAVCGVIPEADIPEEAPEQLDLFMDCEELERERNRESAALERERSLQKAIVGIKKKYGKNSLLKGMNFEDGATARERNRQIGGHKA